MLCKRRELNEWCVRGKGKGGVYLGPHFAEKCGRTLVGNNRPAPKRIRTEETVGEGSRRGRGSRREHQEGRYARYTKEQIEVLEKAYAECSNPDNLQREQIVNEQPLLRGIDIKQLKVWFQNRRCRDKQKKENVDLLTENKKLTAANKQLQEDNDGLLKKLSQIMSENEHLQNRVLSLTSSISTLDVGHQPEANNPQMPIRMADNNRSIVLLAEETREEFLAKAIGAALNWIHAPGLKILHNLGSVGNIYISSSGNGVAARARVTIPLEPVKTIEILKDRPSWSRNCRSMDVIATFPTNNGGTIELLYTQYYASTVSSRARDFWTLRYTCVLDDGSYLVCEKSIYGSDTGVSSPAALEFVRGHMLASGYLICPGEGESTIYIVGHLDLEASSIPLVIRPLYESSELAAKQMVAAPIHYIEHTINENNGKLAEASRLNPVLLRSSSEKLCRAFNGAVNCFSEDGWTLLNADVANNIFMSVKQTESSGAHSNYDRIICIRASLLLQNVLPVSMARVLKEKRSAWMNFDLINNSASPTPLPCFGYPLLNVDHLSEIPEYLGHTNHDNEILDVILFEPANRQHNVSSAHLYYLELINGMEDTGFGASSELIFAQIDRNLPLDAELLSNGFRIILLGSTTDTTDVRNQRATVEHPPSMLVMAFQFPCEAHLQDEVTAIAQKFVQHVISSVKILSRDAMPSRTNQQINFSRGAIPSGTNQQMNFSRRALPSGANQQRNFSREAMPSGANQQRNFSRQAMPSGANQRRNFSWEAMPSGANQQRNFSQEAMPSRTNKRMNFSRESIPSGSNKRMSISREAIPSGTNKQASSSGANPDTEITPESGTNKQMSSSEANPDTEIAPESGTNRQMSSTEANHDTEITPESAFAVNLANLICQSHRSILGVDILGINSQTSDSTLEQIQHHPHAILCFSFSALPVCMYANETALCILETTIDDLPTLAMDRVLGGPSNSLSLSSILPTIMLQGCAILPAGQVVSTANHSVSYGQAVVWRVRGLDGSIHCFALSFIDLSWV